MKKVLPALGGLLLASLLGACTGTTSGEPRLIARSADGGFSDRVPLADGEAAIAVDPDGCQNWLIDDGFEGYASRRRDPRSGLPVCTNRLQPGGVYNEYRVTGLPDIIL